jgi:hypothetical protein
VAVRLLAALTHQLMQRRADRCQEAVCSRPRHTRLIPQSVSHKLWALYRVLPALGMTAESSTGSNHYAYFIA